MALTIIVFDLERERLLFINRSALFVLAELIISSIFCINWDKTSFYGCANNIRIRSWWTIVLAFKDNVFNIPIQFLYNWCLTHHVQYTHSKLKATKSIVVETKTKKVRTFENNLVDSLNSFFFLFNLPLIFLALLVNLCIFIVSRYSLQVSLLFKYFRLIQFSTEVGLILGIWKNYQYEILTFWMN